MREEEYLLPKGVLYDISFLDEFNDLIKQENVGELDEYYEQCEALSEMQENEQKDLFTCRQLLFNFMKV